MGWGGVGQGRAGRAGHLCRGQIDLIQEEPPALPDGLHQGPLHKGKGKALLSHHAGLLSSCHITSKPLPLNPTQTHKFAIRLLVHKLGMCHISMTDGLSLHTNVVNMNGCVLVAALQMWI